MTLDRELINHRATITPNTPTPAILGAFVAGSFQILVSTNPALAYIRHLDNTPTTAKHRNRVDVTLDLTDPDNQDVPIAIYYDEYGELAIWGPEPNQAGAVLQGDPTKGSGGVKRVSGGTGVTVDNTDPARPIINASAGSVSLKYAETTGVTIANDVTETDLYVSGVGSLDLAPDTLVVGYSIEQVIFATLTTAPSSPGTITVKVGFSGGDVVSAGVTIDPNLACIIIIRSWLTCRATGVSGQVNGGLEVTIPGSGVSPIQATGISTIDTTVLQSIQLTFTFDTADPANTLDTTTLSGMVKVGNPA